MSDPYSETNRIAEEAEKKRREDRLQNVRDIYTRMRERQKDTQEPGYYKDLREADNKNNTTASNTGNTLRKIQGGFKKVSASAGLYDDPNTKKDETKKTKKSFDLSSIFGQSSSPSTTQKKGRTKKAAAQSDPFALDFSGYLSGFSSFGDSGQGFKGKKRRSDDSYDADKYLSGFSDFGSYGKGRNRNRNYAASGEFGLTNYDSDKYLAGFSDFGSYGISSRPKKLKPRYKTKIVYRYRTKRKNRR